jgi:hypothetical protein
MHTYATYAILEISAAAFDEIKSKLEAAGYQCQFHNNAGVLVIDMHGIAVKGNDSARDTDTATSGD